MTETPHVFGDFDHLVGIATPPAAQQGDTAVIMVTAGMLHHVGPHRLHVDLARQLAATGTGSFRFDLSGIGESVAVGTSGSSLDRAKSEIQSAMDLLQAEYGLKKFILFGLCSGADDSIHTAVADDRVTGAIAIDGCGFRTPKYAFHRIVSHYAPRTLSVSKWKSLSKRCFGLADENASSAPSLVVGDDIREFPERDQAAREIQLLVDRGVSLRFLYTGGVHDYYNYESQFRDMFHDVDFRDQVSWRYFREFDHVATLCEDRQELVADVVTWVQDQFAQDVALA